VLAGDATELVCGGGGRYEGSASRRSRLFQNLLDNEVPVYVLKGLRSRPWATDED